VSEDARAELYRQMFRVYGQQPDAERMAVYDAVVGVWPSEVLAEGLIRAMRAAENFPPGPGVVRRCCEAAARAHRPLPAIAEPVSEEDRRIAAEFSRRSRIKKDAVGRMLSVGELLAIYSEVNRELGADLRRLAEGPE